MKENKIKWKDGRRKIDELFEHPSNPRRMSKYKAEKLKWSMQKFGQCEAVVIQPNGKIISGHQRIKMLKSIGISEVDVRIPNRKLSEKEENQLLIGLNKIRGEFDDEKLINHFDPLLLLEAGFLKSELDDSIKLKKNLSSYSINIKFNNEEDLRYVEEELQNILFSFPEAKMKVRCK